MEKKTRKCHWHHSGRRHSGGGVCVCCIDTLSTLSLIQLKTVRGRHDGSPDWLNNRIKNQSQKTASRFFTLSLAVLFYRFAVVLQESLHDVSYHTAGFNSDVVSEIGS